KSKF
ncbi:DEAD/DEAH box helicase family protein, partial [Vibrio parahaemolyticus V-223/04]